MNLEPKAQQNHGWTAVLLAALVFVALAPTIPWLEFSSGSENLNVATTLEIHRTGRWLLPTLDDELRIAKPPLTAWITASAVSPQVVRDMSSLDPAVRAAAERSLAWQARWPSLLTACLLLLAVYALGRQVCGPLLGLVSMLVCASTFQFLRQALFATTDIQLALWVAAANACLAGAVLGGRRWLLAPAGVALGLAFMSKGPVGLVQTIVPVAMFTAWRWLDSRRAVRSPGFSPHLGEQAKACTPNSLRGWLVPVVSMIGLFAAVGLPWFIHVYFHAPQVTGRWLSEVTREGATNLEPSKWYNYFSLFPLMLPWTIFLFGGLWLGVEAMLPKRAEGRPARAGREVVFALFLLVVPILIMSFFRDRKERYLLPMVAPASVLAARAFLETCRNWARPNILDKLAVGGHWLIVIAVGVGLPIAGMTALETLDGGRWYAPPLGVGFAIGAAVVVAAAMLLSRRRPMAVLGVTLILMLAAQAIFRFGYRNSREGRSEMKPIASMLWQNAPDARVFFLHSDQKRCPPDLSIYTNRACVWAGPRLDPGPTPYPRAAVIRERKGQLQGEIPANSVFMGKVPRDRDFWRLYLVPAGK